MQTSNPAFSETVYADWALEERRATTMSVQGTAVKTFALLAILIATASWAWYHVSQGANPMPLIIGGLIGGLVLALITIFKPGVAMYTAPLYAAVEGVFLGALSLLIDQRYPAQGLAFNAMALTFGTLFAMLAIYSSGIIKVTDKLRAGIVAATGAIFLTYLVSFLLGWMGVSGAMSLHQATPIGIGFSLLVVGIAAFNLLLDFDFIDKGAQTGAPKSMEWYGAFGLVLTLVWLYISILRLLMKLQDR